MKALTTLKLIAYTLQATIVCLVIVAVMMLAQHTVEAGDSFGPQSQITKEQNVR